MIDLTIRLVYLIPGRRVCLVAVRPAVGPSWRREREVTPALPSSLYFNRASRIMNRQVTVPRFLCRAASEPRGLGRDRITTTPTLPAWLLPELCESNAQRRAGDLKQSRERLLQLEDQQDRPGHRHCR